MTKQEIDRSFKTMAAARATFRQCEQRHLTPARDRFEQAKSKLVRAIIREEITGAKADQLLEQLRSMDLRYPMWWPPKRYDVDPTGLQLQGLAKAASLPWDDIFIVGLMMELNSSDIARKRFLTVEDLARLMKTSPKATNRRVSSLDETSGVIHTPGRIFIDRPKYVQAQKAA